MNIDFNKISQILIESIFDHELDNGLRKQILDGVPDEHYDTACQVFHETRKAYFQLGFTLFKK